MTFLVIISSLQKIETCAFGQLVARLWMRTSCPGRKDLNFDVILFMSFSPFCFSIDISSLSHKIFTVFSTSRAKLPRQYIHIVLSWCVKIKT